MIRRIESVYGVGDKVVIDRNIQIGDTIVFSDFLTEWSEDMEYLKEKKYIVIERVDDEGDYWIENDQICITDDEIDGRYVEKYEEKESYQVGDRVVLDKALLMKDSNFTDENRDLLLAVDYVTITDASFVNAIFCKEVEQFIEHDFIKGLYTETIDLKFHIKMAGNDDDVLHISVYDEYKFKPIDDDSEYYQTVFEKWEAITLINKCPFLYRKIIPNE